MMEYQDNLIE